MLRARKAVFAVFLFYEYGWLCVFSGAVRIAGERKDVRNDQQLKLRAQGKLLRVESEDTCVHGGRKTAPLISMNYQETNEWVGNVRINTAETRNIIAM